MQMNNMNSSTNMCHFIANLQDTEDYINPTQIQDYINKKPDFGFNGLGELVYDRTYSRIMANGEKETWFDTIKRVVNGIFTIYNTYATEQGISEKLNIDPNTMFKMMFDMKFLPPGRGLWACGTDIIKQKGSMALNNCAFVSLNNTKDEPEKPFIFFMDALCLGVGVGYDTYAEDIHVYKPLENEITYTIDDTREGFVMSLRMLLQSYLHENKNAIKFEYHKIRPAGERLKTFGGKSSGSDPLRNMHIQVKNILEKYVGRCLDSRGITDIMCLVGVCVVSGNCRRGATIAIGKITDESFVNLKNYDMNPERASFGYIANNSVIIDDEKDDYTDLCKSFKKYSEPGIIFLDNMKKYSRMMDPPDYKDINIQACNPCGEIPLESYELCNLVEVFLNRIDTYEEYIQILRYAFFYAKCITLVKTRWEETDKIIARNRRIGLSLGGVVNFTYKHSKEKLINFCEGGYKFLDDYDECLSKHLGIPKSIKRTTIKPSGTISLLTGAFPGCHYPIYKCYIRRVRINKDDILVEKYAAKGFSVVEDVVVPSQYIIEFPVKLPDNIPTNPDAATQIEMAALLQHHWADNNVSFTCIVKADIEIDELEKHIKDNRYKLKGITFSPEITTNFPQQPYEEITEEQYTELINKTQSCVDTSVDRKMYPNIKSNYCDGEACMRLNP